MSTYTVPYVVEKTAAGERSMDVYSRLLSERIVYLGTEIDDGVANVLIAQLLHLESDSSEMPINLDINSPGGSPAAMLAVFTTRCSSSGPASRRPASVRPVVPPRFCSPEVRPDNDPSSGTAEWCCTSRRFRVRGRFPT